MDRIAPARDRRGKLAACGNFEQIARRRARFSGRGGPQKSSGMLDEVEWKKGNSVVPTGIEPVSRV